MRISRKTSYTGQQVTVVLRDRTEHTGTLTAWGSSVLRIREGGLPQEFPVMHVTEVRESDAEVSRRAEQAARLMRADDADLIAAELRISGQVTTDEGIQAAGRLTAYLIENLGLTV